MYNIYEPYVGRFLDTSELKKPPENFVVVSPKHTLSERIEIQIPHPIVNIFILFFKK